MKSRYGHENVLFHTARIVKFSILVEDSLTEIEEKTLKEALDSLTEQQKKLLSRHFALTGKV